MSAEKVPHDSSPTYIESVRRQKKGDFDPITAPGHEVIGRFLIQAGHFSGSDEAAGYAATLLAAKDDEALSGADRLMRERLKMIIKDSDISDDRWEDEDHIAEEIYAQLRATMDHSSDFTDQRKALRRLLQLRGADFKDDSSDVDNTERWQVLLRKIGGKALS